jgi:hypothetical protein
LERPPRALSDALADWLEGITWREAMEASGLTRRQLERLADGRYCDAEEIEWARAALHEAGLEPDQDEE